MITQQPSSRAIKTRQIESTTSSTYYFLNSSRKIKYFSNHNSHYTSSSQQSISCLQTSRAHTQTNSPADYMRKLRLTPQQLIPNSFIELYDEYENNYKLVQKIKTDLDISIDVKEPHQEEAINLKTSRSIDQPKQTETNIPNLKYCNIDQELNQRLQISRFKFYYFRASIQKRPSPLSLTVSFENQIASAQFKLYLSTLHEFPTKFNAEYNLTSNYIKIHTCGQENIFDEAYLYMTFYTDIDVTAKIKIVFGHVQRLKAPVKQVKKEYPKFPGLNTLIRTDLIKRNLNTSQFSITKKQDFLAGVFTEREMKRQQVLQKKIEIDQQVKIQKKTQYNVCMMRNDYRFFEKIYKHKLQKKQQKQIFWLQTILLFRFAFEVRLKLIQYKRKVSNKANGRLRALQYGLRLLINVKKFGPNTERRSFCKSLMAISMYAHHIQKINKFQAGKIVSAFIKECISIIYFQHRLLKTRHYVIVLQNKFRFFKRQKKKFNETFWALLTMHYKEVIRGLMQNQKIRSRSQRSVFVHQIDHQIMQMQIDNYFERQKQIWLQFIRQKIKQKMLDNYLTDRKCDEIRKALIHFEEPLLFRIPDITDIAETIELYAKCKKLI